MKTEDTKLAYTSPTLQTFGTMQELTATTFPPGIIDPTTGRPYGGGVGIS